MTKTEVVNQNFKLCSKECIIGIEASKRFLDNDNSAYTAALKFRDFVEECFKTCEFIEKHNCDKLMKDKNT